MLIFKKIHILLPIIMSLSLSNYVYAQNQGSPKVNPTPIERLMEGNKRYVAGKSVCGWTINPTDAQRRQQWATTQKPFAIILGCSDSRVPPEVIFDQRLGDLFVIRVAGNVVDDVVLGSIEYAVKFLEMADPFILVLGHERCGAVSAAVKVTEDKTPVDNHIASIVHLLQPVVLKTKKNQNADFVEDVITANVQSVVQQLKTSTPVLMEAVKNNRLKVMGARYDLNTGTMTIVE